VARRKSKRQRWLRRAARWVRELPIRIRVCVVEAARTVALWALHRAREVALLFAEWCERMEWRIVGDPWDD
jgi:hypothetical protein